MHDFLFTGDYCLNVALITDIYLGEYERSRLVIVSFGNHYCVRLSGNNADTLVRYIRAQGEKAGVSPKLPRLPQ